MPRTDDGYVGPVYIGFDVNFYGLTFDKLYINNNGSVTFDGPLAGYDNFPLTSTQRQIIAPFFADVDTTWFGSPVTYGMGVVNGRWAFGVNWVNVDCYNKLGSRTRQVRNSFQLVLIDRSDTGPGNIDFEFNYNQIQWESGTASGGSGDCLHGAPPRAGFSNGTGAEGTFYELPGSGVVGAFLDDGPGATALIQNRLNTYLSGRYIFSARDGDIIACDGDDDGDLICNHLDNCLDVENPYQDDADGDNQGDVCDECPYDPDNDSDGDSVCGDVDLCAGTVLPERVPTRVLRVNHWADMDGDGIFDTKLPQGKGPQESFTMEHTYGCGCEQIIEALHLGQGHRKFGCSIGAMRNWVSLVNGAMSLDSDSEEGVVAGGCSAGGSGGSAGFLVLTMLGLALWRRRRPGMNS